MEKIYFDDETYIWKTNFDISHMKDDVLEECFGIIKDMEVSTPHDNFGLFSEWKENIDFNGDFESTKKIYQIIKEGLKTCTTLFNENIKLPYNKINADAWINVVRAKNPKQGNFLTETEIKMHIHTDLNHMANLFKPDYTYVHYVQMPDNLEGKDGVLYIEGKYGIIYNILPKENDIIIMEGRIPHVPASARKSTKDRIVIAGNVGFEMIKKINSII
jgi:hypothetical protein